MTDAVGTYVRTYLQTNVIRNKEEKLLKIKKKIKKNKKKTNKHNSSMLYLMKEKKKKIFKTDKTSKILYIKMNVCMFVCLYFIDD